MITLNKISSWEVKDTLNLIEELKRVWTHSGLIKESWTTCKLHKSKSILLLELHTGGMSSNEDVIKVLTNNCLFWLLFWAKSERGGHFYFEIDFYKLGFVSVADYITMRGVSRQYVSQNKDKFDWVEISAKKKLIRECTRQINIS